MTRIKKIRVLVGFVVILPFFLLGCENFNSVAGKANAQKLANTGQWIVIDTSEDTSTPGLGSGTMERSDCTADIAITVKPVTGSDNDKIHLSIHQSNPQYSRIQGLKNRRCNQISNGWRTNAD